MSTPVSLLQNYDRLTNAWDAFDQVSNAENALDLIQAAAQFSAVAAVAGLTGAGIGKFFQKSGLDRVFDSISKNQSYSEYIAQQKFWQVAGGITVADLVDWGINEINDSGVGTAVLLYLFPLNSDINTQYNQSKNWSPPHTDPLVLDLDNDGIETIGIANTVVVFDHDGDGIKTGTGWVNSDDGFLVLDRNGNGTIVTQARNCLAFIPQKPMDLWRQTVLMH